jgi:hypothetical protein
MDDLTWSCMVCKAERPDPEISVYSEKGTRDGISIQVNVRHCNDRQACVDGARQHPNLDAVR